jgi:superfamily II DNA or RNA helicase
MSNMADSAQIRKRATQTLSLRPYQQEALEAIHAVVARNVRRPLISLPTGTGKTVVFAHLLHQG